MEPAINRLKVMTWNVHGLGIYDKPQDKSTPGKIIAVIKQNNPDILCLIEYYTTYKSAFKPHTEQLMTDCGYNEYRFIYDNTLGIKLYVGIAIFSKYPILKMEEISLAGKIKMMSADVQIAKDKIVRTYFLHLQSFMLMDKDKQFIETRENNTSKIEDSLSYSKTFVGKFTRAYIRRANQADSAKKIISNGIYPVIVCGDLNDLPASYTYNTIKGSLNDAFAEKGRGIGHTYNQLLRTLRIDYIFYDPAAFTIIGYKSPSTTLSDHNPAIANFEIK